MKKPIDWKLLREQKMFLYIMADSPSEWQRTNACGLLGLLDAIQDDAVDSGEASEEEVFGPVESESAIRPLEPGEERYRHDGFDRSAGEDFDRFAETMADQFGQE